MAEHTQCSICYEDVSDPRVLPCWHGACFKCIKGIIRTGNGRVVSCHMCRSSCLFENIDSLPVPTVCKLCGNSVMNPRKFPCCDRLCCYDCLKKSAPNGYTNCVNKCREVNLYSIVKLPQARVCPQCFVLHTELPRKCGHLLCSNCFSSHGRNERNCRICKEIAVATPARWANIPAGNRTASTRAQNMHEEAAIELLHLMEQMQYQRPTYPMIKSMMRHNVEKIWKNTLKLLFFFVILLATVLKYGLGFRTWIVAGITMLILRFSIMLSLITWVMCQVFMFAFSLYHFAHAVVFSIIFMITDSVIPPTCTRTRMTWMFALLFLTNRYCAPIFVHRIVLELITYATLFITHVRRYNEGLGTNFSLF